MLEASRQMQVGGVYLIVLLAVSGCAVPPAKVTLVNPKTGESVTCPWEGIVTRSVTAEEAAQQRAWHAEFQRTHNRPPTPVEGCLKGYEISGFVHTPYTNPAHGWSVSYPAGWILNSTDLRSVKIQSPQGSTFALVGIHSITNIAAQNLEEFTDWFLAGWERHLRPGLKVVTLSRRSMRLANDIPAIEVIHELGTGETGRSRKIFAVVRGTGFLIDAETHSKSWTVLQSHFDSMVNSFNHR